MKTLFSFVLGTLAFIMPFSGVSAQNALPATATTSFEVVNISQGNIDATNASNMPGDTLRYQATITSNTDDVNGFVGQIDISNILQNADLVDAGLGTLNGGVLTFPAFSQKAPCAKKYTFFVRIKKDCADVTSMMGTFNSTDSITVPLSCGVMEKPPEYTTQPTYLPQVGPKAGAIIGFIIFLSVLLIIQVSYRREKA